jgi:hypothetical protein
LHLNPNYTRSILLPIAVVAASLCCSGRESHTAGARSSGLAHSIVALEGIEGLFHNQAGIGFEKQLTALLLYESKFMLKELALMSAGLVIPARMVNFGISFRQFGTGVYRDSKIGLAMTRTFGENVSAAVQFSYFFEKIPEIREPMTAFTLEAGCLVKLSEKVTGGIHLFNPVKSPVKTPGGDSIMPLRIRVGEAWRISHQLVWSFEVEKENSMPWLIKSGMEFKPERRVSLRAGVIGRPFQPTAGAGFHLGHFGFDIGFSYHGNLGFAPAAGIFIIL